VAHALNEERPEPAEGEVRKPPTHDTSNRDDKRRVVADAWLAWQCKMVAGVLRGAVFSTTDNRLKAILAHWPATDNRASALGIFASQALETGDVLIHPAQKGSTENNNQSQDHIAIPISNDGGDFVVVMHIVARSQSQQQAVVQLVQWGGMWLGSLDTVVSDISGSASTVSMQLAEQALDHDDLYAACLEAANRLAEELQCNRVSVGLKKGATIECNRNSVCGSFTYPST